jgi:hypothetical protein
MMPKVAPVAFTPEMEQRILQPQPETSLHLSVSTDVSTTVSTPQAAAVRRKEPTVLMNAKLPVRLHARLKRTAQFNDISMTDILIRAIEAELDSGPYTAPPDTWGSDPV